MISNQEVREIYRSDLRGRNVAQIETQDAEEPGARVRKRHPAFISPAQLMQQRLHRAQRNAKRGFVDRRRVGVDPTLLHGPNCGR